MNDYRLFFLQSWQKHLKGHLLSDMEKQVRDVLLMYPQYICELDQDKCYSVEENPYIQMGLHLTMWDQIRTNRPEGIRFWFLNACAQHGEAEVERFTLSVLRKIIYTSYSQEKAPSEQEYLQILKKFCQF